MKAALKLVLGGTLVLALLPATPAAADPPVQTWITGPATLILPGGEFCADFDVQVDVQQKFKVIMFANETGWGFSGITTGGSIQATLTNLDTDQSVTVRIPGPGFIDASGIPIIGAGPWLIFLPGSPGSIQYLIGRMQFTPTEFGVDVELLAGQQLDLCQELAA
jgi:hypothetical protein